MSPPIPVIIGSTRPWTAQAAMEASIAFPPDFRTRRPASEASGWPEATIPWSAATTGRQVEVWARAGTGAERRAKSAKNRSFQAFVIGTPPSNAA